MADDSDDNVGTGKGIGRVIGAGLGGLGAGMQGKTYTPTKYDDSSDDPAKSIQQGIGDIQRTMAKQNSTRPDMSDTGQSTEDQQAAAAGVQGSRKKGGRIKKTGLYRMHKGEYVINAPTVKRLDKMRGKSRKSGRR